MIVLGFDTATQDTAVALTSPLVLRYAVDDLTREVTRGKLVLYGLGRQPLHVLEVSGLSSYFDSLVPD